MLQIKRTLGDKYSAKEITIRELNGQDELNVARTVAAKLGSASTNAFVMAQMQQRELLRASLVEVDGERIETGIPYIQMDNWSKRTLDAAFVLYNEVNGIDDSDIEMQRQSQQVIEGK